MLVETGENKILLDTGPGTMRRLLEAGSEIFDVTHVLLSHFHPDHTGELASFLFSNKYPDGARREKTLAIVGGPGFEDFFRALTGVYGDWIQLSGDPSENHGAARPDRSLHRDRILPIGDRACKPPAGKPGLQNHRAGRKQHRLFRGHGLQ